MRRYIEQYRGWVEVLNLLLPDVPVDLEAGKRDHDNVLMHMLSRMHPEVDLEAAKRDQAKPTRMHPEVVNDHVSWVIIEAAKRDHDNVIKLLQASIEQSDCKS